MGESTSINMTEILSSPRTHIACRRIGIDPKELNARPFKDFYVPGDLPERQKMRFDHFEIRRRQKIDRILAERRVVIDECFNPKSSYSNPPVCSKLVQSLIEKHKRCLVKDVKFHMQLKKFYTTDAANRAERKRKLSHKRKLRESQVSAVEKHRQDRARELGEIIRARFGVRDQILEMNELEYSRKKEEWISRQVDEELQTEHFKKVQQESRSERSVLWSAKYQEILARVSAQEEEEKLKNDEFMTKLRERLHAIEERKQEVIQQKQLRGEEVNLRLIDALSRRQQKDRIDQARREKMAALIQEEDKRSSVLKLIKENILNSKLLVSTTHHTKEMSEIIPLARQGTEPPGPTDYIDIVSWLDTDGGPKISESDASLAHIPGTIDNMVNRAKSVPEAYDVRVLPDGSKPWEELPVLKWSTTEKFSYVDAIQAAKSELPGPASYETAASTMSPRGPKITRDIVHREDVRNRAWINGESDPTLPAPTTYTVDDFTRNEVIINNITTQQDYTKLFKTVIEETKKQHAPSINFDELTI